MTINNDGVMPGLVPGIHVYQAYERDVDGRVKPGHYENVSSSLDCWLGTVPAKFLHHFC